MGRPNEKGVGNKNAFFVVIFHRLKLPEDQNGVKLLFIMMNKTDILKQLGLLGLDPLEALIYFELSRAHLSRLELSRATGINRSKVYRVADGLLARGIIEEAADDKGQRLSTAPIRSLERLLTEGEIRLDQQRQAITHLKEFVASPTSGSEVGVRTFKGEEGLRQQLWNELRESQSEILIFSQGESLNVPFGRHFSQKFRSEVIKRGIKQRALQNIADEPEEYGLSEYFKHFSLRVISKKHLQISREITVLKDRVNIYSWRERVFFGIEIQDRSYARFMKQIFEKYWREGRGAQEDT